MRILDIIELNNNYYELPNGTRVAYINNYKKRKHHGIIVFCVKNIDNSILGYHVRPKNKKYDNFLYPNEFFALK